MDAKIIIPSINSGYIKLAYGYQQIANKMFLMTQELDVEEIVKQILEKEKAYYELESNMPQEFLNSL